MTIFMANLKSKLPPHCQVKNRGKYEDVYFSVHPKDRVEGWPATIKLGRTDRDKPIDILKKAEEVSQEYKNYIATKIIGFIPNKGSFPDVIKRYKESARWKRLAIGSKRNYEFFLRDIEEWSLRAGHPHISKCTQKSLFGWLAKYEDKPRVQKYAKSAMTQLFNAAIKQGYITQNIVKDIQLERYSPKTEITLWTNEEVETLINHADQSGWHSIGTAILIAYETGQRAGDVLSMQKPRDYHEGEFLFSQSKTGKRIGLRATDRLRSRLDALPRENLLLVTHDNTGRKWRNDMFTKRFRLLADEVGMTQHLFRHLRHMFVIDSERAGGTASDIAAVTGHSRKTVQTMIENHYGIDRDKEVADKQMERVSQFRVRQKPAVEVRQK